MEQFKKRVIYGLSMQQFFSVKLLIRECFYFFPVKSKVKPFGERGDSLPAKKENGNKQTIAKRKQSELSYQTITKILDSIQDDFYVLDRNWNFVFASKRLTSRIGKEPKDFVGKNLWKMFPKHLGTVLEENFRATMETREIRRFEIGDKYTKEWYQMTTFPSTEGITVLGTDITERKKAEETLLSKEHELASIYASVPEVLFFLSVKSDCDFRFLSVSQSFLQATGLNEHQVVGKSVQDVIPEPSLSLVLEKYAQAIRERKSVRWEEVTVYPSGRKYGEVSATPFFDSSGHCTTLIGSVYDISERKRGEEALVASEERYRHLLQFAPAAIYEIDFTGPFRNRHGFCDA